MKNNICESCHKEIKKRDWYFFVREIKNKCVISDKFVHKNCQNEYDKMLIERQITPEMKENLNSALSRANDLLTKMGGEEIVYIK